MLDVMNLIDQLDQALPQTQCQQCGYAGCRPYAEAIAQDKIAINRCPPGGMPVLRALAEITQQPVSELDSACGTNKLPQVVAIDESLCIGCTKCIQACPVDAIIGAHKLMHTVIVEECTGCELCLPVCPMDCIVIESVITHVDSTRTGLTAAQLTRAQTSRTRFMAKQQRYQQQKKSSATILPSRVGLAERVNSDVMQDFILQAAQRSKAKYTQNQTAQISQRESKNDPTTS